MMPQNFSQKIVVVGLGPMGLNLALNLKNHHIPVLGYNRSQPKRLIARNQGLQVADSLSQAAKSFSSSRRAFWLMIKSTAVDQILTTIAKYLNKGDIIIEGGNSHFKDTDRRNQWAEKQGLSFIGAGVSGGEEGAHYGPALMPGGNKTAYKIIEPILKTIAAKAPQDQKPCVDYIGPGGAGHFVKMVHNGIEYAIMAAIGEAVWLLRQTLRLTPDKISRLFSAWNKKGQPLNSYLMATAADLLKQKDSKGKGFLIDHVADITRTKGTGPWTATAANELLIPAPTIYAAVSSRLISMQKDFRVKNEIHPGGGRTGSPGVDEIHDALLTATIVAYAEGMQIIAAGSKQYRYHINLKNVALNWRAGCIIRAPKLLQAIADHYSQTSTVNLISSPAIKKYLSTGLPALTAVTTATRQANLPAPVLDSALTYLTQLSSKILYSSSVSALQRDYFGAHGYFRLKETGQFHTNWLDENRPESKLTN